MDKNRKKALKDKYLQMKPEMGIFIVRSKTEKKCYLLATPNLRGVINGAKARLRAGMHPNRELQKAWLEQGEDNFTVEILENLAYDEEETKTDYTEDLALLQMLWEEKLSREGLEFYKKKYD